MKHILVPALVVLVVLLGYLVYLEEETRKQAELNQVLTESANLKNRSGYTTDFASHRINVEISNMMSGDCLIYHTFVWFT